MHPGGLLPLWKPADRGGKPGDRPPPGRSPAQREPSGEAGFQRLGELNLRKIRAPEALCLRRCPQCDYNRPVRRHLGVLGLPRGPYGVGDCLVGFAPGRLPGDLGQRGVGEGQAHGPALGCHPAGERVQCSARRVSSRPVGLPGGSFRHYGNFGAGGTPDSFDSVARRITAAGFFQAVVLARLAGSSKRPATEKAPLRRVRSQRFRRHSDRHRFPFHSPAARRGRIFVRGGNQGWDHCRRSPGGSLDVGHRFRPGDRLVIRPLWAAGFPGAPRFNPAGHPHRGGQCSGAASGPLSGRSVPLQRRSPRGPERSGQQPGHANGAAAYLCRSLCHGRRCRKRPRSAPGLFRGGRLELRLSLT